MANTLDADEELTLILENSAVAAGASLTGQVRVYLRKDTKLTAIRLHLYGSQYVKGEENVPFLDKRSRKVYTQWVTLFGHARNSKEHGKVHLDAGSYTYNFDVPIPATLPPYALYSSTLDGDTGVRYNIEARLEYPHVPATTTSEKIKILATVPPQQLLQALSQALPLGTFKQDRHKCGCQDECCAEPCCLWCSATCCLCNSGAPGEVVVTLDVYPSVLVVHPSLPSGYPLPLPATLDPAIPLQPDANILTVRVGVENLLAEPIYKVEVSLVQMLRYYSTDVTTVVLGSASYDAGDGTGGAQPIVPSGSLVFDATIPVYTNPFPSMKGVYADSATMLVVRFPDHDVPDVRVKGVIVVAGAVGPSDDVPWMPGVFKHRVKCEELIM